MTSENKLKSYAVLFTLAKDWRANVDRLLKNAGQEGITRCGLTIVVGGYKLDDKEQLRGVILERVRPGWQRPDLVEVNFPSPLRDWPQSTDRRGFFGLFDAIKDVIIRVIRTAGDNPIRLIWNPSYPDWTAAGTLAGAALDQVSWIDPPSSTWIAPNVKAIQLQSAVKSSDGRAGLDAIEGESGAIQELKQKISILAPYPFPVLLIGETGTGKELVAKAIHQMSNRSGKLGILNAALLDPELAESKLFGHRKGAFTGASADYAGRILEAEDGTFFLDELNRLPRSAQGHLLRALNRIDEGMIEVEPVGGKDSDIKSIQVRLITACQRNPLRHEDIPADLYYRVAGLVLHVPPLRERGDDVIILANSLIKNINRITNTNGPRRINKHAERRLKDYPWPGNVRELNHALRQAWVTAQGRGSSTITESDLSLEPPDPARAPWRHHQGNIKRWLAHQAVEAAEHAQQDHPKSKTEAARSLGLKTSQELDRLITTYKKDLEIPEEDTHDD